MLKGDTYMSYKNNNPNPHIESSFHLQWTYLLDTSQCVCPKCGASHYKIEQAIIAKRHVIIELECLECFCDTNLHISICTE